MDTKPGKFIVLEGPDSTGKTTMSQRLAKWLQESAGIDAVWTRHPGATATGKELRKLIVESHHPIDPHTRGLMFAADNSAFIHEVLQPKLAAGTWVIADRSNFISSMAYQIADGATFDALDKIHDATAAGGSPPIDLLMIFRASFETIQRRLALRPESEKSDSYQKKLADRKYFDKITNAYASMMEEQSTRLLKFVRPAKSEFTPANTPRCLYIDANGEQDDVFAAIKEAVKTVMLEQVVEL